MIPECCSYCVHELYHTTKEPCKSECLMAARMINKCSGFTPSTSQETSSKVHEVIMKNFKLGFEDDT